ncbi:MAG TPA: VWA-like domain-containing protein [Chloroflexota bacterium]|nr:VWA-like domain-containing protein [Chloroflexota bacterium]
MTVSVRPLHADEARQLTAARLVAVEHAPYLAHALFTASPVAAQGLATFAVDRGWRLYVDPAALQRWGPSVAGRVLVHEVSHLVRAHAERADGLGADYDHLRWGLATDAAINDDLFAAGIPLPDGAVTPASLGLADGGIEEAYYTRLAARHAAALPLDRAGSSEPHCGSGAGAPRAAWELAADDPRAAAIGEADASMTRRRVAQAVRDYASQCGRGTLPGGWTRWAEDALAGPSVPWQRVLASAVRRAIAHVAGCSDYSYRRPGRRRIPRIVTPAMHRPLVTVAVVVDTSGSMGEPQLAAALSEIKGVIRAAGIGGHGLLVLACDAEVGAATRVRRVQNVRLVGGGGTDMRVGIAAAEANAPRPDVVVVLTDGQTPWPERPTRARLVAAIIGDPQAAAGAPSWATTVLVPAA